MKGNVIGPIPLDDWCTMQMLSSSIKWMKNKDPDRYRYSINKETSIYKDYLLHYLWKEPDDGTLSDQKEAA